MLYVSSDCHNFVIITISVINVDSFNIYLVDEETQVRDGNVCLFYMETCLFYRGSTSAIFHKNNDNKDKNKDV